MKMSLYDVALEGSLLEEFLTANEGELTPELEERFDRLLREGPERIEAAAIVAKELETDAQLCRMEAARLTQRRQSFEGQAERLRQRITVALDNAFQGKVKTPRFTVWAQTSPAQTYFDAAPEILERLSIESPELVCVERSLDKTKLREMVEAGEPIPESVTVTEMPGNRYCKIK